MIDTCEVKIGGRWVEIGIQDALAGPKGRICVASLATAGFMLTFDLPLCAHTEDAS